MERWLSFDSISSTCTLMAASWQIVCHSPDDKTKSILTNYVKTAVEEIIGRAVGAGKVPGSSALSRANKEFYYCLVIEFFYSLWHL